MTKLARKRDFRGGSIFEFFNDIDVKRTLVMPGWNVAIGRTAGLQGATSESSLSGRYLPFSDDP